MRSNGLCLLFSRRNVFVLQHANAQYATTTGVGTHHGSTIKYGPLSSSLPEIYALDKRLSTREAIHKFSLDEPDRFWATIARHRLKWDKDFHTAQTCDMAVGKFEWFVGGKLNVTVNCLDRHVEHSPDKVALLWERDEPGTHLAVTYRELLQMVCRIANVLKADKVQKGDRVVIYMPKSPLAVAAMLACARIGAVHSVVFAGFSADALAARIVGADAHLLITSDQGLRGGKAIELKRTADQALAKCPRVRSVYVMKRTGAAVPMMDKRDRYLEEEMAKQSDVCDPVSLDSEDPLFMLYTSGSTGNPKGIVHSQAGYLLYAAFTHSLVFDVRPNDIFGCVADIGWITGHTYAVYGPLCNGVTTVLFESIPTHPNPGRYWEMVERLKITQFYGAPTAIRLLIRWLWSVLSRYAIAWGPETLEKLPTITNKYGHEWPRKYDRSTLRVLGSVGEPINHEAWEWYHDVVGEGKCTLVDTWWQTETGGIVISPAPADQNSVVKPAIAMRPMFGQKPVIFDETEYGQAPDTGEAFGALCLSRPWPGIARTIYGDHQRYVDTYFKQHKGFYCTGDGATRDGNGYYGITGRMDDVINTSGHRLGTAEIEDILDEHCDVAESAVVPYPHTIKGEAIFAFVDLKETIHEKKAEILDDLRKSVKQSIASYAVPDYFLITPSGGLPKTRSGKIMRRILRKIACGDFDNLGDTSTLADPTVVAGLITGFKDQIGKVKGQ